MARRSSSTSSRLDPARMREDPRGGFTSATPRRATSHTWSALAKVVFHLRRSSLVTSWPQLSTTRTRRPETTGVGGPHEQDATRSGVHVVAPPRFDAGVIDPVEQRARIPRVKRGALVDGYGHQTARGAIKELASPPESAAAYWLPPARQKKTTRRPLPNVKNCASGAKGRFVHAPGRLLLDAVLFSLVLLAFDFSLGSLLLIEQDRFDGRDPS